MWSWYHRPNKAEGEIPFFIFDDGTSRQVPLGFHDNHPREQRRLASPNASNCFCLNRYLETNGDIRRCGFPAVGFSRTHCEIAFVCFVRTDCCQGFLFDGAILMVRYPRSSHLKFHIQYRLECTVDHEGFVGELEEEYGSDVVLDDFQPQQVSIQNDGQVRIFKR